MKKSLLFLILAYMFSTCTGEENGFAPCTTVEQLNRAKLQKAFTTMPASDGGTYDLIVYQANYRGDDVFIEVTCCPSCNTLPPSVRDRNGIRVGYLGVDIDFDLLAHTIVVCRTHNGVCG